MGVDDDVVLVAGRIAGEVGVAIGGVVNMNTEVDAIGVLRLAAVVMSDTRAVVSVTKLAVSDVAMVAGSVVEATSVVISVVVSTTL